MRNCFVCMPLIDELRDVYEAIETEVRDTLGDQWKCAKADDLRRPGMVVERIVRSLLNSDLVIAVVADPREGNSINPNVMYELGIAHSFRKPTIVVADIRNQLPFNIQDVETIRLDLSSPAFLSELRRDLQRSLQDSEILEDLNGARIPRNPVTTQLQGTRIFIEDLPWLWGYCEVLKREREATSVWEITRDLYWPREKLFFATLKEAIRKGRKHYYMVEDNESVLRKMETIRNELQPEFSKNRINELVHFVAIEKKYFLLWPIAVVLYDADLATREGGIICEPMRAEVGDDSFDAEIHALYQQHEKSGDLDSFQESLFQRSWTKRREEATFDICLDRGVVSDLATSFARIWNEEILEEAQKKTGDEKTALLNTWLIGGVRE